MAQEYFQKPLSVNTIRRAIFRCQLKLYHAKRKPDVNMVQKRHVLEGTMNAESYIKGLEQHMLPSRGRVFQQDNAKPHTAAITTAWLHSRRVRWWIDLQSRSFTIENIWPIIKRKIRQRRPQILQQLETYIRQEWDQIPTLQKLITSMPRRLQTVLRRGDATPW